MQKVHRCDVIIAMAKGELTARLQEEIEARKKVEQQLKEHETYLRGMSEVIETIASSPELTKQFKEARAEKLGIKTETTEPDPKPDTGVVTEYKTDPKVDILDKKVASVESSRREEIITAFEQKYGIDKLPSDKQKEARGKIQDFVKGWGWSVTSLPLETLSRNLESAYIGTHPERLKEEGANEAYIKTRANGNAMMGTISGGAPGMEDQPILSDRQREFLQKAGIDPKEAEQVYKERDNEQTRVPKAEKAAAEAKMAN